jgi:FkbM family methyltransferase
MRQKLAQAIAGSRTGRYLVGKLANEPWFQPIAELMLHRVSTGFRVLRACAFRPALVIDAGAYVGDWTRAAQPYFPEARFVMIEAQPDKAERLRPLCNERVVLHSCLLGDAEKDAVRFHLAETGSSVYAEVTSFKANGEITLPMRTLDGIVGNEPGPIFLKLDVQGAELDVLRGAMGTLDRVEAILLEASIREYNLGAPRIAEVIAFLAQRGFSVFDIVDHRRVGAVLAQVDLIFVRDHSTVAAQADQYIRQYGS